MAQVGDRELPRRHVGEEAENVVEPVALIPCREHEQLGVVQLEGQLEILLALDPRCELDCFSKGSSGGCPLLVR